MKTKIYKQISLLSIICILFMSSCLKDDNFVDFSKVETLIELPLAAFRPSTHAASGTVYKLEVKTYTSNATPSELQVAVNIAAPQPLSADLGVTLGVDESALTTLKSKIGNTSFVLLPPGGYTITDPKVIIPSGQNVKILTIKINTAAINKAITTYILPISILDASGQKLSNYKTVFYNIKVS